tara:strand:+ start:61 stop:291 length:231 start_codon:yes stop_codon:yes gene_type:complete
VNYGGKSKKMSFGFEIDLNDIDEFPDILLQTKKKTKKETTKHFEKLQTHIYCKGCDCYIKNWSQHTKTKKHNTAKK